MSVKDEPMDDQSTDPIELENKILELCSEFPDGLPDGVIPLRIPNCTAQQRASAINRLLAQAKLDLLRSGSTLLYKARNLVNLEKIKGSTKEEEIIYHIIEEAGNRGIWVRDIRVQSNLAQAQLNKVLKTLESRKLVKSIKSVGAARKKTYMLFEMEPDVAVTGGAFYSDQDVDMQFVDLLNQQCLKYLRGKAQFASEKYSDPIMKSKASFVASIEICRHINELKISKIELTVKDMERVLDTLVYDGSVEKDDQQGSMYRAVQPILIDAAGYTRVPCSVCPVFADCRPGGIISPATCSYFKDWLS